MFTLHLLLAHRRHGALRPGQHRLLHRRHRRVSQIGPAAPWFILAVMLFSYAVRSVYIESCSMFVRGGVYRVVKEAMGGPLARLAVWRLLFDYILTGPISGVSAGQYIIGLSTTCLTWGHRGQLMENRLSARIAIVDHASTSGGSTSRASTSRATGPEDHGRDDRHGRSS